MRTIHKFAIPGRAGQYGEFSVRAPTLSTPIHVGLDPSGSASIWMEVETDLDLERHMFAKVGTGIERIREPDSFEGGDYIGSYVDGQYVWHIYYYGWDNSQEDDWEGRRDREA